MNKRTRHTPTPHPTTHLALHELVRGHEHRRDDLEGAANHAALVGAGVLHEHHPCFLEQLVPCLRRGEQVGPVSVHPDVERTKQPINERTNKRKKKTHTHTGTHTHKNRTPSKVNKSLVFPDRTNKNTHT